MNEYLLKTVVELVETLYERYSISGKSTVTDVFIRLSAVLDAIQADPQLAHLHGWVDDLDARVDRATPLDFCPACGSESSVSHCAGCGTSLAH